MSVSENYLAISDLQIPFENEKALAFCRYIKRHYKVPDENCLCVGDEVDQYFGSGYGKDPNGKHTAVSEIRQSIETLRTWYDVFPKMKVAVSNHGLRWAKKAVDAEIPSQMMRAYQEVIEAPKGWVWQDRWLFKTKHPFRMIHGMGYSGQSGHRTAAMDAGISTVIGHLHSHAGVAYIKTNEYKIWGMNTGCLIDPDAYAFHYGRDSRFKPCLGAAVICNDGSMPIWIPLE